GSRRRRRTRSRPTHPSRSGSQRAIARAGCPNSAGLMAESAVPILPSRDLDETLEFYARLGFELQGAPIEKYRYLIIGRGSIELHFWDAPNVDPLTTDASCYIRVDDADALHRERQQAGIESDPVSGSRLMPPVDTDYGIREFALVDRSGNLLRIGSPL